ncbi:MAG: hypothetical protein HKN47_26200 [Pirellulaceae bacterium]|nr:hypothetical protein [Pirellulaceae bacterium]
MEAAPCCGGTVTMGYSGAPMEGGFDLQPGETVVPGSVVTLGEAGAVESASDAGATTEELPTAEATDDAPPAPTPDANTDI